MKIKTILGKISSKDQYGTHVTTHTNAENKKSAKFSIDEKAQGNHGHNDSNILGSNHTSKNKNSRTFSLDLTNSNLFQMRPAESKPNLKQKAKPKHFSLLHKSETLKNKFDQKKNTRTNSTNLYSNTECNRSLSGEKNTQTGQQGGTKEKSMLRDFKKQKSVKMVTSFSKYKKLNSTKHGKKAIHLANEDNLGCHMSGFNTNKHINTGNHQTINNSLLRESTKTPSSLSHSINKKPEKPAHKKSKSIYYNKADLSSLNQQFRQKQTPASNQSSIVPSRPSSTINASSKLRRSSKNSAEAETELESLGSSPLSDSCVKKLEDIKNSIIDVLNSTQHKTQVLAELQKIYRQIAKTSSPLLSSADDDSFLKKTINSAHSGCENDALKKENQELKKRVELIDRKFDVICDENTDLREYIKDKTDNIEELKTVIKGFQTDLNNLKRAQEGQRDSKHGTTEGNINSSIGENKATESCKSEPSSFRLCPFPTETGATRVPKLNFNGNCQNENVAYEPFDIEKTASFAPEGENNLNSANSGQKMGSLNLTQLPKSSDFNEEFLEHYDDFSPSWRRDVEKMNSKFF